MTNAGEDEEELTRLRSYSSPPPIDLTNEELVDEDGDDEDFFRTNKEDSLLTSRALAQNPEVDFIDPQLCLLIFQQTPGKLATALLPIVYFLDHQCFFAHTRYQLDTGALKAVLDREVFSSRYRATTDTLPVLYVLKDLKNARFAPLKRDQKLNFPDLKEYATLSVEEISRDERLVFAVHETAMVIKAPNTTKLEFARTCLHCHKMAARHQVWKRCSACKHAYYCSQACQEESWGVFHSKVCGRLLRMKMKTEETYYNFNTA